MNDGNTSDVEIEYWIISLDQPEREPHAKEKSFKEAGKKLLRTQLSKDGDYALKPVVKRDSKANMNTVPEKRSTTITKPTKSPEHIEEDQHSSGRYDIPDTFYNHVVEWDWPNSIPPGSKQAENVVSMIYRLMAMDDFTPEAFNVAKENRADEARNEDPNLSDDYESTIRDNCIRSRGFTERNAVRQTATKDFLHEAKTLVDDYKNEYR